MVRFTTQILVGLMLFFGFITLLPKAVIEFRAGRPGHGIKYTLLALLAVFFSCMAFFYAYLQVTR